MKRISVLLMTLVLSVSLLVFPASADEVYVATFCPQNFFDTGYFTISDLPLGDYHLEIIPSDGAYPKFVLSDCIYVGPEAAEGSNASYVYEVELVFFENVEADPVIAENSLVYVYNHGDHIVFDIFGPEDEFIPYEYFGVEFSLYLVPVKDEGPVSGDSSLSGIVNGDMLSGVLDNIVSLLPAVLVLIVAYIAIRKGIGFIRDLLHAA